MPKNAFVKLDLRPLQKYRRGLHDGLQSGRGPFGTMVERWGLRVQAFWQRKFRQNSSGGGDWPPLAPATIAADKRRRNGILRITGAIYRALFRGESGSLFQRRGNRLFVGLGGPGRHPGTEVTVAGLAMIHNEGKGVPKRQIIYPPDAATVAAMKQDVAPASAEMIRRAS
jgi:hypothetical protein